MALNLRKTEWAGALDLLDRALDLPAEARDAWLAALGADHEHLVPIVRRLLDERRAIETGQFLQSLPAMPDAIRAKSGAFAMGQRIGPYALLRELGHGGMASVWLAERADGAHGREVALKLPYLGARAQVIGARFARERQILSALTHPHVASVLDAGADGAQPWLAMEYVEGLPITEWATQQCLDVRARLRLFLQVLEAVAHAHAQLVIHRDIKPSNVLVDTQGQVKLLDFGVAKLLGDDGAAHDTELTQLGGRAFTPQYASPEQISGQVLGTASDVYSLGVLLYELLVGQLPYRLKRDTPAALEEAIVAADVAPPSRAAAASALRRILRGDIDTIVMRAIAPLPAQRYDSVRALAADIESHLAIRPIAARPASAAQVATKWLRRNAFASAAGFALALALTGGAATTAWQYRLARDEAQRAERAKRFVLSIFEDADSTAGANKETTARDLLEQAQARAAREFSDDFATQLELQSSLAYSLLGQGAAAKAVAALEPLVARALNDLGPLHRQTLRAQRVLGEGLVDTGRSEQAVSVLRAAADGAATVGEHSVRVGALQWLSSALFDRGQGDEANLVATQAVELADRADIQIDLPTRLYAWSGLANVRASTGRPGIAAAAQRALDIGQQLYSSSDAVPMLHVRVMLGRGQYAEERFEEATQTLSSVLSKMQMLHDPQHSNVVATKRYLALAQRGSGHLTEALETFGEVLASLEINDNGKPTARRALAHASIADALSQLGRPNEALAAARHARVLFEQAGHLTKTASYPMRLTTAEVLAQLGRPVEAEAELKALLELVQSADAVTRAKVEGPLAVLQALRGDTEPAVARARGADAVLQSEGPLTSGRAALELGRTLLAASQADAAVEPLQRSLQALRQAQPQGSPLVTAAQQALDQAQRPK